MSYVLYFMFTYKRRDSILIASTCSRSRVTAESLENAKLARKSTVISSDWSVLRFILHSSIVSVDLVRVQYALATSTSMTAMIGVLIGHNEIAFLAVLVGSFFTLRISI